jgi:hypothetical protein
MAQLFGFGSASALRLDQIAGAGKQHLGGYFG